ncbi:MAG: dTDP-4-dehydrorhamnose 3,5-epimerase family protein [Thermoleophilia bacterium]|nr:dTDP-4-dehydrorhamnose 3,5-epimerase family protein [Thermoleophilia bacterium]
MTDSSTQPIVDPGVRERHDLAPCASRIEGVLVLPLTRHGDERGGFTETYRTEWFDGPAMVQGNRSDSAAGTIRGLHFHRKQADYWLCLKGTLLVALHDTRTNSPSAGVTQGIVLTGDTTTGIYIPPGVAHGFGALEDSTLTYLVDNYYDGADEFGVRWDDPEVAMDWGIEHPILSGRDAECPTLADVRAAGELPA